MADRLIIGCGYLGQRLAQRWRDDGDHVWVTTRNPTRAEEWRSLGLDPLVCDVMVPDSLRQLPRVDTVVYCVGMDRSAGHSMRAVYVEGLHHVLEVLPTPERFVHVSSTSVYGQSQGEEVDEASATEPVEESGRIILDAERTLHGIVPHAMVLRFAGMYGPGRLLRAQALRDGQPLLGDADRWLNLIHINDGVRSVEAAVQRGQRGAIYNVCDDHPVTRREFYTFLAHLLHAPEARFAVIPAGAPVPPGEQTNRRVLNRRLRQELNVPLEYPSYRVGLPASL